jgi:hypothetical protein
MIKLKKQYCIRKMLIKKTCLNRTLFEESLVSTYLQCEDLGAEA